MSNNRTFIRITMETLAYILLVIAFIVLAGWLVRTDKRNTRAYIEKGIEEDKKLIEQLKREREKYLQKIEDAKNS